jgi:uncharacterized protein (TIGR00369 family)
VSADGKAGAPKAGPRDITEIANFQRHIGVTRIAAAEGRSEVTLDLVDATRNYKGDAHGGLIAALMDIAMSRAVRSANPDAWGFSTISMTVNFLAPGRTALVARGRLVRSGTTIAVAEAEIEGEDGVEVARASAVFRIIKDAPRR